ncbi:MAG: branched-chain amino acid aminotransferase [Deltaproteobacteria bacterium]|nr:branched-chain amino acid aminotransferase [Deltaproteobacteria bacterium]
MAITIQPASPQSLRPKPADESKLGFGKLYSDHMFSMRWKPDTGWTEAKVEAFGPIGLSPAALVLHYGQTIFEGLKAYRNQTGGLNLFRPLENCRRLNRSAQRLDLPQIEESLFIEAIEALLHLDQDWVPKSYGSSLYIRPTMIATEPYIGLKSAQDVLMYIITGPVGAYYPEGFNPVRITVCENYSRAAPGGLGAVKTAANYAASLLAAKEALTHGYTQVLWLDAAERKYVEEVGSMNIFFKIAGEVLTPPLSSGTILPGITRDSVIALLKQWGIPVREHRLSIGDVVAAQENGTLEEVFGAGTAAVISPVGLLEYKGKHYNVAEGTTGKLANRLFEELMGIQYGTRPDPMGWIHSVALTQKKAKIPKVTMAAV